MSNGEEKTSNKIPIDEINNMNSNELSDDKASLLRILYCPPIDISNITTISKAYTNTTTHQDNIGQIYNSYYSTVDGTNSELYSTGDTATDQKGKLESVTENIETILSGYSEISRMLTEVINTYNIKLKELKVGVKKKLLIQAAEEINNQAISGTSPYVKRTATEEFDSNHFPVNKEVVGKDEYVYYRNITNKTENNNGTIINKIYADATYYVYFKYWGWFPGDFWTLFDWDEDKIIKKFKENNIPLPYDESLVVDVGDIELTEYSTII